MPHQLQKNFIDNIIEYFNVDFLTAYSFAENEEFYKYHMNKWADGFIVKWNDKNEPHRHLVETFPDHEPAMIKVNKFLESYYPHCDKESIFKKVTYTTFQESDYHHGLIIRHTKQLFLYDLYIELIRQDNNVLYTKLNCEPEIYQKQFYQFYDQKVQDYAHIIVNIDLKDYDKIKLSEKLDNQLPQNDLDNIKQKKIKL